VPTGEPVTDIYGRHHCVVSDCINDAFAQSVLVHERGTDNNALGAGIDQRESILGRPNAPADLTPHTLVTQSPDCAKGREPAAARSIEIHDVHDGSTGAHPLHTNADRLRVVHRDLFVTPAKKTDCFSVKNVEGGDHIHTDSCSLS
jgi:hypothetical protein